MASVDERLTNIAVIDAETWAREEKEEKERAVRSRGRLFVYREGQEESFWGIPKEKVRFGFEGLEEYLLLKCKR